jgi:hypothetical protein
VLQGRIFRIFLEPLHADIICEQLIARLGMSPRGGEPPLWITWHVSPFYPVSCAR